MTLEMSVDKVSMYQAIIDYFLKHGQTCETRWVQGVLEKPVDPW